MNKKFTVFALIAVLGSSIPSHSVNHFWELPLEDIFKVSLAQSAACAFAATGTAAGLVCVLHTTLFAHQLIEYAKKKFGYGPKDGSITLKISKYYDTEVYHYAKEIIRPRVKIEVRNYREYKSAHEHVHDLKLHVWGYFTKDDLLDAVTGCKLCKHIVKNYCSSKVFAGEIEDSWEASFDSLPQMN